MKSLKIIGALLIVIFSISLVSCKVGRFIIYNVSDIRDYKKFPKRVLHKPDISFTFPVSDSPKAPKRITIENKETSFEDFLQHNGTVAFVIIKNDSIQYEKYFEGYQQPDIVPSFSMAKSVTSLLIGCAIDDGLIASVNDPIIKYIPELSKNGFDKVTIEHLLQMTSGLRFREGYINPFSEVASFYYGRTLRKSILKLKLKHPPGTQFEYTSGTTQLLGLVLERALQNKTITQYLEEKIWQPLGMQYDASWSIDNNKNGIEKTFCCINATAIDFAKIGRLMLHKGNWNGKQIVSEKWVEKCSIIDTTNGAVSYYQYQWWLPTRNGDLLANGHLGQYVYINRNKNIVMVRLGKKAGKTNWGNIFVSLSDLY